jgi:hypothetical protein
MIAPLWEAQIQKKILLLFVAAAEAQLSSNRAWQCLSEPPKASSSPV